jgi:hypothetical protein
MPPPITTTSAASGSACELSIRTTGGDIEKDSLLEGSGTIHRRSIY